MLYQVIDEVTSNNKLTHYWNQDFLFIVFFYFELSEVYLLFLQLKLMSIHLVLH